MPKPDILEVHGTTAGGLTPSSIVSAAEYDLRRRERNGPSGINTVGQYEPYAFHRNHVVKASKADIPSAAKRRRAFVMRGSEMKKIRERLGLSVIQFGRALGYAGADNTVSVMIRAYERDGGTREIPKWIAVATRAMDAGSIADVMSDSLGFSGVGRDRMIKAARDIVKFLMGDMTP